MRDLNYIELSGKKLPIRCSNFVLAKIQKKYETLTKFEDLIMGRKKGEKKGEYEKQEVSIEAMNDLLIWCIQDGLETEAFLKNRPAEEMSERAIMNLIDINPYALQVKLVEEFIAAFAIKK